MTYDEAIEAIVSKAAVMYELRRHGADASEFFAECGDHDEYEGASVLGWLGY